VHHDRNTQLSRGSPPGMVQRPDRWQAMLDATWHPSLLAPQHARPRIDRCNHPHANLAWWIRPRRHFSCEEEQCKMTFVLLAAISGRFS